MPQGIRWARALSEGVVIVASILLAFGIQAAWDWRQERLMEQDVLERLEAEFTEADVILKDWQGYHQSVLDAAEVLLAHTQPTPALGLSADSVAALIGIIRIPWSLDASFSTLSALDSSGQLTSITNQDLLIRLASFRAIIADLQENETDLAADKTDLLVPYLYQHVAFRVSPIRSLGRPGEPSSFAGGFLELLQQREFENIVAGLRGGNDQHSPKLSSSP